jgi:acetylornithine deacetylase
MLRRLRVGRRLVVQENDVVELDPTVRLLEELVAIDSVNPSLVPGSRGEVEMARRIAFACMDAGLAVEITEIAPGRPNVVAVLEGRAPGPALLFCGHTDTVGVAGMAAPFEPVRRDGLLYGRGAQDMKGGLAAIVGAARALAESGGLARGRLIVAAVIDEEHASLGAEALVATWRADAAVVTEPTDLQVATGHKGFEWVEVVTRGRAAHGSRPSDGRDAILRMGRVLAGLESLNRRLQAGPAHPLLGTPSLHASTIAGGRELSSYPDRCTLQVERRTIPGEALDAGWLETRALLDQLGREDPEFDADARQMFSRQAYEIAPSHSLPEMLSTAARSVGCVTRLAGMTYWSDAAILGAAGVPAVLFGPGGAGLHSPEEHVKLDEVLLCRDALVVLARRFMQ